MIVRQEFIDELKEACERYDDARKAWEKNEDSTSHRIEYRVQREYLENLIAHNQSELAQCILALFDALKHFGNRLVELEKRARADH